MALPNITELTCDEALALYTAKFFRAVYAETPAIPASYDGKYAIAVLLATDIAPDDTQMSALETAIEAITNVHKAFALIGPARIPVDRVPTDHELFIGVQAGFDIRPVEVV